jgi:hypothetical protein
LLCGGEVVEWVVVVVERDRGGDDALPVWGDSVEAGAGNFGDEAVASEFGDEA